MTESPNNPTPPQSSNSQDDEEVFPAINDSKVVFLSSLSKAAWTTAGAIFILALTQLLTYCSDEKLENKKRESELIKQALTPGNQEQAEQNLIFLVRSRLIDCDQFKTISEHLPFPKQSPEIAVNSDIFNDYYIPKGDKKNGYKVEFSEKEKNCRIIRALLTTAPFAFGKPNVPNPNQTKYSKAVDLQNQGFNALLNNDIKLAQNLFNQAYRIYPTLYNIDEIKNLLSASNKKPIEEIYCKIINDYSWGMPTDLKQKMISQGNCK